MILCGFSCAGKSTLGKGVAKQFNIPFYDTDRLMEGDQKKSVSELWQELGAEVFRDFETTIILSLKREPCVIATGGGTLLREENRLHLKQLAETFYLKASVSVLWERLQKRGTPAYLSLENPRKQVEQFTKERFQIFEGYCDHIIETEGRTINQCVTHLVKFFESRRGENLTVKR